MQPKDIEHILHTRILSGVSKPGRYLGNEHNIITKDWDQELTTMALAFPDVYDTAMPYNGFQILYHILNREKDIAAERVYAPWPDMEALMREHGLPMYSLESKHDLKDFDIVGFSLPYDLLYTNIVNMLDLSDIPIWARDRSDSDPIIMAGGTNAYNPEPVADFFDVVVIGDAEELLADLVRTIGRARKDGVSRTELLKQLSEFPEGVYVPSLYETQPNENGERIITGKKHEPAPDRVKSAKIPNLEASNYPTKPIVPIIETAQDRFAVEVMRGCTQGCRFCHAGMVYRPVRERKPEELIASTKTTLEATGQKNMSLLSLSTSDYTGLGETVNGLKPYLRENRVSVSFPSMRLDTFTKEIASIAAEERKSGLTFAPEAGTWRMRRVINKLISDEDLHSSVRIALDGGWKTLKFYFMLGLPTETQADLQGIVDLINQVREMAQPYGRIKINVTLSTFIPKPETPFQWEAQDSKEVIREKIDFLMKQLKQKNVRASYRDPKYSEIEGVISRGDRRVAQAIYNAWADGARFDSWGDYFRYDRWMKAFDEADVDYQSYLRERDVDEALPWDIVDNSILKKFLKRERRKAYQEATVIDCRDGCLACGVCDFDELIMRIVKDDTVADSEHKPEPFKVAPREPEPELDGQTPVFTARLKFSKKGMASYLGHLDIQKLIIRSIGLARIPVVYSQGFNRRPKISSGPALPLGYTSETEFMDVLCFRRVADIQEAMNEHLPQGLEILEATWFDGRTEAITSHINAIQQQIQFENDISELLLNESKQNFEHKKNVYIERERKRRKISLDIKEYIQSITIKGNSLEVTSLVKDGKGIRMNEFLPSFFEVPVEKVPLHTVHRKAVVLAE
ncbi:MAG: TIGR03960 family B12-binding radical SAM protein [Candidatus Marinimicrobia bacterium]|nr:TIGR03960 family B12-binding radical SAM protein [Candidatus Neomarinimicrobiota bacterium]MCF7850217.1 TIGR03960 family B12-binding radical SAM protein [Candidatus Neomarinimicrobiota bacterium]MCF7903741.1 TIGR03960 family B12-binding radical SAM protein [Candidatus Neomarinimicrobiota bacterium]